MEFSIVLQKKGTELIPDIKTKNVTEKEYTHQTNKLVHPKILGEGKGVCFAIDTQQEGWTIIYFYVYATVKKRSCNRVKLKHNSKYLSMYKYKMY